MVFLFVPPKTLLNTLLWSHPFCLWLSYRGLCLVADSLNCKITTMWRMYCFGFSFYSGEFRIWRTSKTNNILAAHQYFYFSLLRYDSGVRALSGVAWSIPETVDCDIVREAEESLPPQQTPKEGPVSGSTWSSSAVGFLWHKILFRNYSDVCHRNVLYIVWLLKTTIVIDSTSW